MNLKDVTIRHSLRPTGVLHVGAAMLEEAPQYSEMGLPAIWVEALPHDDQRYARAQQFKQLVWEELALSDTNGEGTLRVTNNLVSSSLLPLTRHSLLYPDITVTKELKVKMRRGDNVFKNGDAWTPNINTMVLDAQGNELRILEGMGALMSQIHYVICEVFINPLYDGSATRPQVQQWMTAHGFQSIEFEEVHRGEWGNELFAKISVNKENAIRRAMGVDGLMTEEELRIMAGLLPPVVFPRVLETGAWLGRSATLWHSLGATVFTVDDWSGAWATQQTEPGHFLETFKAGTDPRIIAIKANTITEHQLLHTAVTLLFSVRKADLVFIDANHSTEGVDCDLKLAKAAAGPTTVICGHDADFPEVRAALDKHYPGKYKAISNKLWVVEK